MTGIRIDRSLIEQVAGLLLTRSQPTADTSGPCVDPPSLAIEYALREWIATEADRQVRAMGRTAREADRR